MGSCCVGWEASLVKNHNGKTQGLRHTSDSLDKQWYLLVHGVIVNWNRQWCTTQQ